jgi:ATP-dependent Clp protease protease subunit
MNSLEKDFVLFAKSRGISSGLINSYIEPTVVEERNMNMTAISVFSRLMMDRVIFLGTEINSDSANIISAQLLWLDSIDPSKDITMQISSPGGSVYDGYKILDTIDFIKSDVSTVSMGMVASMAAVIACSGTKGKRFILPRARFMIHQPLGGASGQASDILINAKEIEKVRTELYSILSDNSNLSYEEIEKMADRDCYMDAKQSVEHGFMDQIINKNK